MKICKVEFGDPIGTRYGFTPGETRLISVHNGEAEVMDVQVGGRWFVARTIVITILDYHKELERLTSEGTELDRADFGATIHLLHMSEVEGLRQRAETQADAPKAYTAQELWFMWRQSMDEIRRRADELMTDPARPADWNGAHKEVREAWEVLARKVARGNAPFTPAPGDGQIVVDRKDVEEVVGVAEDAVDFEPHSFGSSQFKPAVDRLKAAPPYIRGLELAPGLHVRDDLRAPDPQWVAPDPKKTQTTTFQPMPPTSAVLEATKALDDVLMKVAAGENPMAELVDKAADLVGAVRKMPAAEEEPERVTITRGSMLAKKMKEQDPEKYEAALEGYAKSLATGSFGADLTPLECLEANLQGDYERDHDSRTAEPKPEPAAWMIGPADGEPMPTSDLEMVDWARKTRWMVEPLYLDPPTARPAQHSMRQPRAPTLDVRSPAEAVQGEAERLTDLAEAYREERRAAVKIIGLVDLAEPRHGLGNFDEVSLTIGTLVDRGWQLTVLPEVIVKAVKDIVYGGDWEAYYDDAVTAVRRLMAGQKA